MVKAFINSGEYRERFLRQAVSGEIPDGSGYQFRVNTLNQFEWELRAAEMVKAFITFGEDRGRFPD